MTRSEVTPVARSVAWRARVLSGPHALLGAAIALALAAEYVFRKQHDDTILVLVQSLVVSLALLNAWRHQDRLRLPVVLALTLAFHLGTVLLHIGIGLHADWDPREVYTPQGQSLLDGNYPRSEYPLGAVLLFAFETLLGGGNAERPNGLLMVPFQLVLVAAVWHSRRRLAPWLATTIAVSPATVYFWEFRYDLVPAALLAVGLVLALRERWVWSGLALGLGAFFKWTPGLAIVALAVWLLANRRLKHTARLLVGTLVVTVLHIPFAILTPSDLAAAYGHQGGRSITAESIWFPPLHVFGVVDFPGAVWQVAGAPGWADAVAIVAQTLALLAIVAVAAVVRRRETAVALAALMPATFLFTNRIFSPQFLVVMMVGWAIAVALLAEGRREQLVLGAAGVAAAVLNVFVYPFPMPFHLSWGPFWELCSAGLFGISLGITAWVVLRAWGRRRASPRPSLWDEHDRSQRRLLPSDAEGAGSLPPLLD